MCSIGWDFDSVVVNCLLCDILCCIVVSWMYVVVFVYLFVGVVMLWIVGVLWFDVYYWEIEWYFWMGIVFEVVCV